MLRSQATGSSPTQSVSLGRMIGLMALMLVFLCGPFFLNGEAFVGGLASIFVPRTFAFMLTGIVIGFIVGILPGLGGSVTLALMLPFTFDMQPVEAFAFLLGMLSVTATTGDITSILFGVPGEVISAALVVDVARDALLPGGNGHARGATGGEGEEQDERRGAQGAGE